ncbi:protein kinase [Streptomyces sp. NPDC048436]|uniref:serine/threonine-protein kinase n=1 Tax=Streptomyces sp. NPDC048436 TaxID=3365550 RepID=UPI003712DF3D
MTSATGGGRDKDAAEGIGGDDGDGDDDLSGGIKPLTAADPARIGPYLLLGRLGAGGMGRVYLARSESGRTVAVKVVHEEHVTNAQFRARFRREIDAAQRVGERYTAPVLDADSDAEFPWVATGYVPGLSLEQVVRGHGPLPVKSVHALADGLLHALKDIHSAGIVHRDLKPSNVMLTVEGPRVIDFGIARAMRTSSVESLLTSTGMVIGSPGFMAPEQIRGQSAGPKSDVFTLGCVLTYAATGVLPFGNGVSNQHAVMYQIVEAEPGLDKVRDEGLRALIARCLTKEVDERPGVDELLAEVGRARPLTAAASWLPAEVVTHLAQQAARLLDAEVAEPVREEAPQVAGTLDRETARLRREGAAPGVAVIAAEGTAAGTSAQEHKRARRRRPLVIALPVVAVLSVGGGTFVALQPFGGDSDDQASPPSSSAPAAPGPDGSGSPSGSPSKDGKEGGDRKDKKDRGGKDGADGKDGENAGDGEGGEDSKGAGGSGGSSGSGSDSDSGSGSGSGSGSSGSGTSPGGSSGSGSDSGSGSEGDGGSGDSGSGGGGSGSGGTVPAFFSDSWRFGGDYNIGQPDKVTISGSGTVRLVMESNTSCTYSAKVTSTESQGSRINVGTASFVGDRPPFCSATLDPSYFTINGNGIQHNVGPSHGEGYYYKRA